MKTEPKSIAEAVDRRRKIVEDMASFEAWLADDKKIKKGDKTWRERRTRAETRTDLEKLQHESRELDLWIHARHHAERLAVSAARKAYFDERGEWPTSDWRPVIIPASGKKP